MAGFIARPRRAPRSRRTNPCHPRPGTRQSSRGSPGCGTVVPQTSSQHGPLAHSVYRNRLHAQLWVIPVRICGSHQARRHGRSTQQTAFGSHARTAKVCQQRLSTSATKVEPCISTANSVRSGITLDFQTCPPSYSHNIEARLSVHPAACCEDQASRPNRTLEVLPMHLGQSCVSPLSALRCSLAREQRLHRQLPFLLRKAQSSMSKQLGGIVGIGAGIWVSAGPEAPAVCACDNAKRNQLQFGP